MNDTNIENPSCYELENLKRRTSKKTTSFAGEDANIFIVIFIVFVLGVNDALLLIFHLLLKTNTFNQIKSSELISQ